MKVLVANPPAYIGDHRRHFIQAGSRWSFSILMHKNTHVRDHYLPYPFFLGYSSTLLKRDVDVETRAIDACALDFDEKDFLHFVKTYYPDILVIEVPTLSFPLVMEILREVKKLTECKVVVVGPHVTALTREVMENYNFIDYCLFGEYEVSLKELILKLKDEQEDYQSLKEIKGLAFRYGDKIIINGRRELLKELDYLPFPDREDFPIKRYHDFEIVGKPCIQMLTSRGCPFSCSFCLERHVFYDSPLYRKRRKKLIVDEIEVSREKYNAKQIYFDDETMTVDRRHVKEFCEELLSRGLDAPWSCMGDVTLDSETLRQMAKAGCAGIKFGVETVSAQTLKSINKTFLNQNKVKNFVKECKKLGIWTHATYIVGLPNDKREDILKTLDFALSLDTDSAQVSIATPFPGTPFYELCEKEGWLITKNWTLYDGANFSVVSYPWLSREGIEELYRLFKRELERGILKGYLTSPPRMLRYLRGKGIRYSLRRLLEVLSV